MTFRHPVRTVPLAVAWAALAAGIAAPLGAQEEGDAARPPRTASEVLADAPPADWRALDQESLVYLELPGGRVVLELAPLFAPRHVANVRALVRAGRFDGGGVVRSQDNYVAQWTVRPLGEGEEPGEGVADALPAELDAPAAGLSFTRLPDGDVYAPEVGFVDGMPVALDPEAGRAWIAHCYGAVGVARGNDPDSGSGAQLYAVTGHAPRHLDRNLTMVGRVVLGMEHLTTLPRGTGSLGFYESAEEVVPIRSASLGSDLPPDRREPLEALRTDSPSFRDMVEASRTRTEAFFVHSPDAIGLCNVRLPVRSAR